MSTYDRSTTVVPLARQQALGDLLRRSARRYPDKTAVVASCRRVSDAEFDESVNRCANSLQALGLLKGDRLGLLSHNCWQFAVRSSCFRGRAARTRTGAGELHVEGAGGGLHPRAAGSRGHGRRGHFAGHRAGGTPDRRSRGRGPRHDLLQSDRGEGGSVYAAAAVSSTPDDGELGWDADSQAPRRCQDGHRDQVAVSADRGWGMRPINHAPS